MHSKLKAKIVIMSIIVVIAIALYNLPSSAQGTLGCCCDPVTGSSSFTTQQQCAGLNYTFAGFNPNLTCAQLCNATVIAPTVPPTAPPAACGSPTYTPAPLVSASPVRGEKDIALSLAMVCPADFINISRCLGNDCTDFIQIKRLAPVATYVDTDAGLLWDTDYRYRVIAEYNVAGPSDAAFATANTGDLECWFQYDSTEFCIGSATYDHFRTYLQDNGYDDTTASDFNTDFATAVSATFSGRFRKGFACNAFNRLGSPTVSCTASEICIADDTGADCIAPTPCDGGNIFGLYSSIDSCEGSGSSKNYCFFDRSASIIDKCYLCRPKMRCMDYRSSGTCQRDNCGLGACEWRDVFTDIGIGVCVDTRFNNCPLCTDQGSFDATNTESYNEVFDQCTDQKAKALSTERYPCFFNKHQQKGASCDTATCLDYSPLQCASPSGGIQLGPDNAVEAGSDDPCGIGVCQLHSEFGCVKNADGDSIAVLDCSPLLPDRQACELDYLPPETLLFLEGEKANQHDYVNVIIFDKTHKKDKGSEYQGKDGYLARMCVVGSNSTCSDAATFPITTNSTQLNLNDLSLQDGATVIASLQEGNNTLKYYSVDKRKNLEVVKEIGVRACKKCQGPKALKVTVTPGNHVEGDYYTRSYTPVITVEFNEPAQLSAVGLTFGTTDMQLSISPTTGFNHKYTITPSASLNEGLHNFLLNAVDGNGTAMNFPLGFRLFVDVTPPELISWSPPDGEVFDTTTVDMNMTFNEKILLADASLDELLFINKFVKKAIPIPLADFMETEDNLTFTGLAKNLQDGLHIFNMSVTDYAGNKFPGYKVFTIATGPPKIRIAHPSWGVSSTYTFAAIFESSIKADCRYIYDVPTAPPETQFDFLKSFAASNGISHTTEEITIPANTTDSKPIHVYCKNDDGITQESFDLFVDSVPPELVNVFAHPKVIAEEFFPGLGIYQTTFKAQMNELGFCRYSNTTQNFDQMQFVFPGFDELPKQSHSVAVNVSQETNYTYYVACKDKAELKSETLPVTFHVDLSLPFNVSSQTPPYSNDTQFYLRVETNKRGFCYWGESELEIAKCFGNCSYSFGHADLVTKDIGTHAFFVKCNNGAKGEVTPVINITVSIDNTPPFMVYADDTSSLPEFPELSWQTNRLRVAHLGNDTETDVIKYWLFLESATQEPVIQWAPSLITDGQPYYIQYDELGNRINLFDGQQYRFRIKAENRAGLASEEMASDGVTIDITKMPPHCINEEQDSNETDIDCGGVCAGCAFGMKCNINDDCDSLYCNNFLCDMPACDDEIKNGRETDIDCGNGCAGCAFGQFCAVSSDCAPGMSCRYGACGDLDPCEDGELTSAEADIDCGGACPNKCGDGQNCNMQEDCQPGLVCKDNTCLAPVDRDLDGVVDTFDVCPNTPYEERELVDARGCSPSQTFSCGDAIDDAWRIKYFGSLLCTGKGAADADPDRDGLDNLGEYRQGTDPTKKDTDGDRWKDGTEVRKGTDPLNPNEYPVGAFRSLLYFLLFLLILAALGIGGWYGYQWYLEKTKKPPAKPALPPKKPAKQWPQVIEQLRRFSKRPERLPEPEPGWLSVTAMKELAKKVKKEEVTPAVFKRLQKILDERVSEKEKAELEEAIEGEPAVMAKLRKISIGHMSAAERKKTKQKFKAMLAGRLTEQETERLLKKLKMTAAYYKKHKKQLEKELKEW